MRAPNSILLHPGTVSGILWHFTGGPKWNEKTRKQETRPKASRQAYAHLRSILHTKALRLGAYREIVTVVLPEVQRRGREKTKVVTQKQVRRQIESSPVCCLSDIPIMHLGYHAQRYGKFAIGFHRDAVSRAGFNPVLYTLSDTDVIRKVYTGLSVLDPIDTGEIRSAAESIATACEELEEYQQTAGTASDIELHVSDLRAEAEVIEHYQREARGSIHDFLAFIKTFERQEFATVYCEREWRSVRPFNFSFDAVAMIVLPEQVGRAKYFEPFCRTVVPKLKLPRAIPVVPWEHLVER